MEEYLVTYGFFALFCGAFLAATLAPLSSEAMLALAVSLGMEPVASLLVASVGNTLACVFNYALGLCAGRTAPRRMRRTRGGRLAWLWARKYGMAAMALSWLPVVGDPITVCAGLFRLNFPLFLLLAAFFRAGRYALVVQFI